MSVMNGVSKYGVCVYIYSAFGTWILFVKRMGRVVDGWMDG